RQRLWAAARPSLRKVRGRTGEYRYRIWGQEAQEGAADDVVAGQEAPHAAVGALGAVVAHDKVLAVSHGIGRVAAIAQMLDIRLVELDLLAVCAGYIDRAPLYGNGLAGEPDNALNVELARVARRAENNDIAALGR